MSTRHLIEYLEASAQRFPGRTAVVDPDGTALSYAELNRQSDAIAGYLAARGIGPGDRVGIVAPKSAAVVAVLFGVMKAGAAYVPVDPTGPLDRGRGILEDCGVRALFVHHRLLDVVPSHELAALVVVGPEGSAASTIGNGVPFDTVLAAGAPAPSVDKQPADLAYILYTSGSTGIPKGVMLTHDNAVSFVDWCSETFAPMETDRFSSHAPFHFDLSVLDVYVSLKHGAELHLISEGLGKNPKDLARFIAERRITVWYSTPSILTLLLQFGQLAALDVTLLRLVFFAGEVFPVKHLRELKRTWPAPVYFNLYGPTETNVCTFARIPEVVSEDRVAPYPIGHPCAHCSALVLDGDGREVQHGQEGLLYISGRSVFGGYWNRPAENAAAFLERDGVRWYNTGDVVRWEDEGGFIYVGRRDRMVKRRGYRIELGEIERALYQHPRVREAAVVALPDPDTGVKIVACLACEDGARLSVVDLKTFASGTLPAYMSPDRFAFVDRLPKTSTDKIDYQRLKAEVAGALAS